jgi:hypothetical protein
MKAPAALSLACILLLPDSVGAGKKPPPAPVSLTEEHWNAARTLSIRTPAGWTFSSLPGGPEVSEARGEGFVIVILRREGEIGLDSLHVECMLARLKPAMEMSPQVEYEYDFVGGELGARRLLDSAFVVHYDEPIDGHRDWRQRNLTVVGEGESVCVVAHAPLSVWKKSKPARNLLTSILESMRF